MKYIEMTFPEIVDFTGYNLRRPTADETNLVFRHFLSSAIRTKEKKEGPIPAERMAEETQKIVSCFYEEMTATSWVLEFKDMGTRIFVHHRIAVLHEDGSEERDYVLKKAKELFPEAQGEPVIVNGPNIPVHHHVNIACDYLKIDAENNVHCIHSSVMEACLMKTQQTTKRCER